MLNSKDRGKCRNSSGKRFRISSDRRLKVGNFRPISRATPSSLRLFTTPGNLIGDGTRYTSVSRILIIQGGIIFSLSFSLSPIAENSRETRSIFYLQRVTLEMANEVEFENFENYENYANFQESSIELKNSCLFLSKKVEKTELKKKVCFDRIEIILDEIYTSKIKTLLTI